MVNVKTSEQLARINPDSKAVLYLVLTVTTVIAAVAFAVSFAGLAAVSEWAQIPPRLSWALPVFIDGAILGFTIMILVFRARGESTAFAWVVLIVFTVISVGANAAHAYAEGAPEDWRTIVGSGLAGLAPAGLAVFIHGIARLLVAPPDAPVGDVELVAAVTEGDEQPSPEDDGPGGGISTGNGLLPMDPAKILTRSERFDESMLARAEEVETPTPALLTASGVETEDSEEHLSREEQIQAAIQQSEEGISQADIGVALGVSRATVGRWLRAHKETLAKGQHLRAVKG